MTRRCRVCGERFSPRWHQHGKEPVRCWRSACALEEQRRKRATREYRRTPCAVCNREPHEGRTCKGRAA